MLPARNLAPPMGELSPKVTEREPSPSSLRSATSPKGRGKLTHVGASQGRFLLLCIQSLIPKPPAHRAGGSLCT